MSKSSTEDVVGCGILVATIPLSAIWSGFVLKQMWAWFIVTTFHAPMLSIPTAIGLAAVVSYLTKQSTPTDKEASTSERVVRVLGEAFVYPLIVLVFGWVVHQFT